MSGGFANPPPFKITDNKIDNHPDTDQKNDNKYDNRKTIARMQNQSCELRGLGIRLWLRIKW